MKTPTNSITVGRYRADSTGTNRWILWAGDEEIVTGSRSFCLDEAFRLSREDERKHSLVIASAEELFKACVFARKRAMMDDNVIRCLDAAIAKAGGMPT